MLCQECDKRETCREMCKEMEAHLESQEVDWGETPVSIYMDKEEYRIYDSITKTDKPLFSPTQTKIVYLMGLGLTSSEICKVLDISRDNLKTQRYKIRKKGKQITKGEGVYS